MISPLPRRSLLAVAGLTPLHLVASARQESPEEAVVRRFYDEVLSSAGDLAAIDEVLAPDFVPQDASDVAGPDAYKQRRVDQREALDVLFSEWRWVIEDLMTSGNRVSVRATVEGVGRYTETSDRSVLSFGWFVVDGGRITRFWTLADDLS